MEKHVSGVRLLILMLMLSSPHQKTEHFWFSLPPKHASFLLCDGEANEAHVESTIASPSSLVCKASPLAYVLFSPLISVLLQ